MERAIPYQSKTDRREANSKNSFIREIRKNHLIYLSYFPGILLVFIFAYLPMFGIVIAFQDYNPVKGVFGSEFVGFKNFQVFLDQCVMKVIINRFSQFLVYHLRDFCFRFDCNRVVRAKGRNFKAIRKLS